MAFVKRNPGENDGRFELLDNKALVAQYHHITNEMERARTAFDKQKAEAIQVRAEMKKRNLL